MSRSRAAGPGRTPAVLALLLLAPLAAVGVQGAVEPDAGLHQRYPLQTASFRGPADTVRTRHGGSEAFQKLEEEPVLRLLFEGYPFSLDYREERGHAFMLADHDASLRSRLVAQPGGCLHCHSAVMPAYRRAGRQLGIPDSRPEAQVDRGFVALCAIPLSEARQQVHGPMECGDCHDPKTMELRVTRPAFLRAIRELAASGAPVPSLPSIGQWRKIPRAESPVYNPNTRASHQEMKTLVCAQCHAEYSFQGPGRLLVYPWQRGLGADAALQWYNSRRHSDWRHPRSGAALLKAQHPEFELYSQSIHARRGVGCADCHMPRREQDGARYHDHGVQSPFLNEETTRASCGGCHEDWRGYRERSLAAQDRLQSTLRAAQEEVAGLIRELERAAREGVAPPRLAAGRQAQRTAQWRLDYVQAENSMGFHAPEEAERLVAAAITAARSARKALGEAPVTPGADRLPPGNSRPARPPAGPVPRR
jgi:nitrite reductase (cytochrome c-552)